MKSSKFQRTRVAAAVAAALFTFVAGHACGAGFALQEESASGLGNAFAGGAAAAEDASSMSVNPATLSKIGSTQVVAGVHLVTPSFKFKDNYEEIGRRVSILEEEFDLMEKCSYTTIQAQKKQEIKPLNKKYQ